MTTAITMLLLVIALGVGLSAIILYNILLTLESMGKTENKILQAQLNPRTRMSTVAVQSGPVTEEQQARLVGRATASKRVVFGGDPESDQYQRLQAQYPSGVDDE